MEIRPLEPSDRELVDRVLPLSRLDQHDRDGSTYLVAWDGADPVGHAHIAWEATTAGVPELQDVYVLPERRREGIARRLTLAAEDEVRRRGFGTISLSVSAEGNEAARSLYESLGYRDAGLEPVRVLGTIILRGEPFHADDTLVYLSKNLGVRGEDGLLPAMQALYRGDREEAVRLLPPDEELTTHEAATFGRIERLRALLDEGPERVGEWSPDGFTPLHGAIFGGSEEAVGLLIERGADLEAVSTASFAQVRPLGTAVFVRSVPLAALLLEAGADPNGEQEGGFTPLDAAVQNEDGELIDLLTAHGARKRDED
jgi:GNAT superfamily N-acetyltransferase